MVNEAHLLSLLVATRGLRLRGGQRKEKASGEVRWPCKLLELNELFALLVVGDLVDRFGGDNLFNHVDFACFCTVDCLIDSAIRYFTA